EDGIRDRNVTGVQTCALPIFAILANMVSMTKTKLIVREAALLGGQPKEDLKLKLIGGLYRLTSTVVSLSEGVKENLMKRYGVPRSEERRVGKEGRCTLK